MLTNLQCSNNSNPPLNITINNVETIFPHFNTNVRSVRSKLHYLHIGNMQGRIQDFKLGGGALKKIAPSRGRRENFWGISCEKSRFYAKKSYFSNFGGGGGGGREIFGVFHVKNHDLRQNNHIFTNFRGGRTPGAPRCAPPPPLNPPLI